MFVQTAPASSQMQKLFGYANSIGYKIQQPSAGDLYNHPVQPRSMEASAIECTSAQQALDAKHTQHTDTLTCSKIM